MPSLFRGLALLCFLVAVGAAVAQTGAYTAISADRGVGFDIADDSNALIGLQVVQTVDASTEATLVTVTNNIDDPVTVSVSLTPQTDDGVTLVEEEKQLSPGQTEAFRVQIDRSERPQRIVFSLTAESTGDAVTVVSLTRETTVEDITRVCTGPTLTIDTDRNGGVKNVEKDVDVADDISVRGGISDIGCLFVGDRANINGKIQSVDGKIEIGRSATVRGGIESVEESATVGADATVNGGINDVGGTVTLEAGATVNGGVRNVDGDVIIAEGAVVRGQITNVQGEVIRQGG